MCVCVCLPLFDVADGLFGGVVVVGLHGAVHVAQLHLSAEIHINGRAFDRCAGEVLHGVPQPCVIDSGQLGFGPFEHEEGSQVGRVRGDDDHREARPDHAQDAGREAPRGAWRDRKNNQSALTRYRREKWNLPLHIGIYWYLGSLIHFLSYVSKQPNLSVSRKNSIEY